MTGAMVSVDGRPVLHSGTIVANMNERITIYPFEATPDFGLNFYFSIKALGASDLNHAVDGAKAYTVKITKTWNTSEKLSVRVPIIFAFNEVFRYSVKFVLDTAGSISDYSWILHYTIFSEKK